MKDVMLLLLLAISLVGVPTTCSAGGFFNKDKEAVPPPAAAAAPPAKTLTEVCMEVKPQSHSCSCEKTGADVDGAGVEGSVVNTEEQAEAS